MKSVYLGTDQETFKENYKKALLEYYGDKAEIKAEDATKIIFKIPFAQEYFASVLYGKTTLKIGTEDKISGTDIDVNFLFRKLNTRTTSSLLILKENSITLLQTDYDNYDNRNGGQSIYSILNTDKGLVFFSCCKNPNGIEACKSIHIESELDLTPVTFGNQILSDKHEVLKQPFRLTDKNGEIYTALDIYNISYKPEAFTALPKSFISSWNLASKDNPQEPIMTSLLIYDEEEEG